MAYGRKNSRAHQDLLDTARDRFAQGEAADQKQWEREREDSKLYAGDQWPADVKLARQGLPGNQTSGMPPIPARPCLTINLLKEKVRVVLNQERQSEFGIELVPADDFAGLVGHQDETEIELREGLARRIQRDSHAADARSWAFSRATTVGRGYEIVRTRYLPGKTSDQEVYIDKIFNQFSVVLDPLHEASDGNDAQWGFLSTLLSADAFAAQFGAKAAKDYTDCDDATFRALCDTYPGWFEEQEAGRAASRKRMRYVRVTEYFYLEHETRTLATLADGTDVWLDEFPDGLLSYVGFDDLTDEERQIIAQTTPDAIMDEREVDQPRMCWVKMTAKRVLEETVLPSPDMPIVKFVGEELHLYDEERRTEGMVRPTADAQRSFNAMVSKQVEAVAYAPIPPLQVDPLAIRGYEAWYQLANTRALPYLPSATYDAQGRQLNAVHRTDTGADITGIAQSVALFREAVDATSAVPTVATGGGDANATTGRAIRLLQDKAEQSTSNFLDNFKRSLRREGEIINNYLYPIYGRRPGRLARIVNAQGEPQTVAIGRQPPGMNGNAPKVYKLTPDAHFNVAIKVTKAFETRREQESTFLGELIGKNPAFMAIYGDLFFENFDVPGHQQMAERAKVMLDPKILGMIEQAKSGQQPLPPPVMAHIAQQQQQIQELTQMVQLAKREIDTKTVEMQAKDKIATEDRAADIEKERMRNATTIEVAQINARAKGVASATEQRNEALALHLDHVQESEQGAMDREHERQLAMRAQQHAAAMGAAGVGAEAEAGEAERAHAAEQADYDRQQVTE